MQVIRELTPWGYRYQIVGAPMRHHGDYEFVDTPVMLGGYISMHMAPWVRQYLRAVDVYLARRLLGAPEGMTISEWFARYMSSLSGRPIRESMRQFHADIAWMIGDAVSATSPSLPARLVAQELYDLFEDIR